jgi:hypothetical protein
MWHVRDVYHNGGGIFGFWRGVGPTMVRAILLNATKLGTYDTIKHWLIDSGTFVDGVPCQFISSVIAGFFMSVVTSPIDNVRTRLMNNPEKHKGVISCAKHMINHEGGLFSFYKGFGPTWARFAPFTTI